MRSFDASLFELRLSLFFPKYIYSNGSSMVLQKEPNKYQTEQQLETLEQAWEKPFNKKFEIFQSLMTLAYFLDENKIIHRNIRPESLVLQQSIVRLRNFGSYQGDKDKFGNRLSEQEQKKIYPYLSLKFLKLLLIKDDFQNRTYQMKLREDQVAIALVILEIFFPVYFNSQKKKISLQSCIEFQQSIKINSQLFYGELDTISKYVIDVVLQILLQSQLPEKKKFLQESNELKIYLSLINDDIKQGDNQNQSMINSINCSKSKILFEEEDSPTKNQASTTQKEDLENIQDESQFAELSVNRIEQIESSNQFLQQFQKQRPPQFILIRQPINYGPHIENENTTYEGIFDQNGNFIQGEIRKFVIKGDKKYIKVYKNIRVHTLNLKQRFKKDKNELTTKDTFEFLDGINCQLIIYEIQEAKINKFKLILHYEGIIMDGQPHGYGTMIDYSNNVKYEGEWEGGKKQGYGEFKILDNKFYLQGNLYKYKGLFYQDQFHGQGIIYYKDDDTLYEQGRFSHNLPKGFHGRREVKRNLVERKSVLYIQLCWIFQISFTFPFQLKNQF